MKKILGISGSLRAGSYNTALLRTAQSLAAPHCELELATLHGIPLYDGDVEDKDGIPPAVVQLKERIVASDGVLLVTPEYNAGIPGVFKNAIDWCSRPSADIRKVFGQRPFAVIGASQGNFGTILSQNAWHSVLKRLGAQQWFGGTVMVSRAAQAFDAQGELQDAKIVEQIRKFMEGFAQFSGRR
jgi:NAD(P)H-dependent FMN reductase